MENAAEALKIAFAVLMFGLALTLSISTLSSANLAISNIVELRDKTLDYTYIASTEDKRIVGAETVIPTMYKAYNENFRLVFYKRVGTDLVGIPLFYVIDVNTGVRKKDELGNDILINYLDLEQEIYGNTEQTNPIAHLNAILSGDATGTVFANQLYSAYPNGLYEDLIKDNYFEELLGEYYQEDAEAGKETPGLEINKTKKRVITYILQ